MHSGDTSTPAERLRLLHDEYLTPRAGHRAQRTATTTEASAPIRLEVYDYIRAAVDEAVEVTAVLRDGASPARPAPAEAQAVYRWMVEETAHLSAVSQQARDIVMYRQGLEHAILMGDAKTVRRHSCPGCDTWGLVWDRVSETVVCLNRYCADDDGQHTTWTLKQIAHHHIKRRDFLAARAT